MNDTSPQAGGPAAKKSAFDAEPSDLGGVVARRGFAYQDDVAAGFYIEMLENPSLFEVACETYDDIKLGRQIGAIKVVEFVQVKSDQPDSLWSISKLCERKKSSSKPDGLGTSILEKSLEHDQFSEKSLFRVVTSRQVGAELDLLVTCEPEHEWRNKSHPRFKSIDSGVRTRLENILSPNGNDATYWLQNSRWNVIPEDTIQELNCARLAKVLNAMGHPYDWDTVKNIYNHLRLLAKETAEYGPIRWKEKSIARDALRQKVEQWLNPYPNASSTEKLDLKLAQAGLDETCRQAAQEQRRYYMQKKRDPQYLGIEAASDVEIQVLGKLHELRSNLDSNRIVESGIKFHDRCLSAVTDIAPTLTGLSQQRAASFLTGCMYEITARCSHRFMKPRQ
jgi:hypothetical protein